MKHLKTLSALAFAFVLLVFLSAAASAQTAVTLTGRVTDAQGNPLAGLGIVLRGSAGPEATTDADGRYALSVPAGTYELYIHSPDNYDSSVHAPPYYSLQTTSFDILQNTTLNLQLPFKKLSVHVQDSQGAAVANVVMAAGNAYACIAIGSVPSGILFAGGNSYYMGAMHGVVTNTYGDVDLWLLPTPADPLSCGFSGPSTYSLSAQPPAGSQLALTSLSDVVLTQDSSVTITLPPGVSLAGQVTDGHGNPLSGLLIRLRGYYPPTGGIAMTDANGRYGFSVSPGTYSLRVDHNRELSKPYDSWDFDLTSDAFEITQNMTLDLPLPFKRVTVHVVDGNGQPVPGVHLGTSGPYADPMTIGGIPFTGSSTYSYDTSTGEGLKTDANGNASLLLLPAGGYTITAYPPAETGWPPVSFYSVPVTGDINLTLRLDGTILANPPVLASLSPASAEVMGPSFTLVVTGTDFVNSSVVLWNGAERSTTYVSSTQLAASIPSTDIVSAGTANVIVWTPAPGGGGSNSLTFTINSGPPVSLSGRITDAAGIGLPNQSITLYGPISPSSFPEMMSGSTDGNGHYAFTVSTGYYMMRVDGGVPADSTLHAPQSYFLGSDSQFSVTQNMTLDFALPSQRTNVHAMDANDQPVDGAGLNARGPMLYGLTFSGVTFEGSSGYSYDTSTGAGVKTDSNGNATLWLFPASDPANGYTIEAYPPYETGLSTASLYGVLVTGETNLTVRFDGVLPVKVPTVSGQVTDAQGNPLSGLTVGLRSWPGEPNVVEVTTDANGRYALSAPTAGIYNLSVGNGQPWGCTTYGTGPFGWWCFYLESPGSWFEVNQNMALNLALPFKRVNVHTVDANGQPMAGVGLETSQPRSDLITIGGVSFSGYSYYYYDLWLGDGVRTDANGNATFWLFPSSDPNSGGYTIRGYPPSETGLPLKSLPNVVVTGDTSVTISFSAFTLSGRITDADGNGLPGQRVVLGNGSPSDSNGYYTITNYPGDYPLGIYGGVPFGSPLHVPVTYQLDSQPISFTQNMTLDFALRFQRVNVHVVDASNQPVEGAILDARDLAHASQITISGVTFSGYTQYWHNPSLGDGIKTDANGNATLWLFPTTDPSGGYSISAYGPSGSGLTSVTLDSVLVTGETNVTLRFPANVPTVSTISPTSAPAGGPSFTLVVTGTNFVNTSVVRWNGAGLATTFVSGTSLTATVPATLTVGWGTASITVFTPPPGGGTSNSATLTVVKVATVSTVASSAPTPVYGQSITLTATVTSTVGVPSGTVSFKDGSTVLGSGTLTNGVSTLITSTLPVGTHAITVYYGGNNTFNPSTSPALNQTVNKAITTLALTGSSPSPAVVGQPVTVTWAIAVAAPGSGNPTGAVTVGDGSVSCTASLPSTSCPITFSAAGSKSLVATYAGDANFSASTSPSMTLTVNNPVPVLTGLSPNSAKAGDPGFLLTVTGSNFMNESVVQWNGSPLTTAFVNSTSLNVTVPASSIATPGAGYVKVLNPTPGGGESNAQVLLTTNTGAAVTATSVGTSTTTTGTATATITGAGGQPSLTTTAAGIGTISVAQYAANPGGTPSFNSAGAFADVHVASGSAFTSVTIVDCNLNGGNVVYWWNGAAWMLASDQAYNAETGCVTIMVNDTTSPNLHALTGTYLASSSDRTAPTVSAKGTTSTGDYTFGQWVTQTVQITLTAQDNDGGTGVKKIVYSATGAQSISVTEMVSSTASISITAEGETQVTYAAVDNAGNRATDQTAVVKIDKTLPTLGTCPMAGPFLLNSGLQSVGPIVASDVPSGLDVAASQLAGSVDTSSLGVKTMTFVARDLAGNSSSKSCTYAVIPSATLNVFTALHTVGAGTTPGVQKAPLAMSLKIFDRATVPSADLTNYAAVWNSGPGLVPPLALLSGPSVTTFGGGQANLYAVQVPAADSANQVTSGRYLVIGKVEGAETYVGAATDPLAPNSVTQEYLQVIRKSDGKNVPAVTTSVPGSLLLIAEPAYLEFTSDTELLPIIYDSVDGTWNAVVQADPPQGFVSTPGALSVDVSTGQLAAVQFTVQDVGSQWTTTKITNRIKHKGVDRTVTSSVAMINRQPATTKTPTPTATRTATLTASRTLTPTATMTPMPKPTGTATAAPTATQTPKPKPTSKVVPASPTPKPTATPKKQPTATPTAVRTKLSTATPPALPTQTPMRPATATPKKQPTATPMATWTLPPTKTPHLTPTPRDKPTKR